MATANNSTLRVSDLDFFSIRNNLKEFLRSQDTFTDYDFEGSGLSVLLDVLSYNTYYNSFYLNMVANESFLDTAQIRQNVLSHAKVINYVPTSMRAAKAFVNVQIIPSRNENRNKSTLTLDKYTKFIGADIDGINYQFVTTQSYTVPKTGTYFMFSNVAIRQGEVITQQYAVEPVNSRRRFTLPSANIDTSTLVVTVQESSANTMTREYFLSNDITEINANSFVYFLEENENLQYTIQFGDGVLGYRPKDGNIVQVTYLDTNGGYGNNVNKFVATSRVANLYSDDIRVFTQTPSFGGSDKEDIDQIRFRAPQFYTAQNRAVTVSDYESLLVKDYPNIEAVSIWGGEENNPPVYGKVYMSIKTKGYYTLTDAEKEVIKRDLIRNRNVITVVPEIVDPNYIFVLVNGKVTYNPNLTSKTANELFISVKDAVMRYSRENLNSFRSTFRRSVLQNYIQDCDPAITGSDISIILQKQIEVLTGATKRYAFTFGTELERGDSVYQKLYSFPSLRVNDGAFIERDVYFEEVANPSTGIASIHVLKPGRDYIEPPTVVINGDGFGAAAVASIDEYGRVISIKVTSRGRNYSYAYITLVGQTGVEAEAAAVLEEDNGTIHSYYDLANGDRVIVNSSAGTINYDTGNVVLNALLPLAVANNSFYDVSTLTVNATPKGQIIPPLRNRILTIDENNSQSVQISMIAEY